MRTQVSRSSIEPDHVTRGPVSHSLFDRLAVGLGRSLILGSLIYACWRFGGVQSVALRDLAAMLSIAAVCGLLSKRVRTAQARVPVIGLTLLLLFAAYGWVQTTPLHWWPADHGGRPAQADLDLLQQTATQLDADGTSPEFPAAAISLIADDTRQALVPWVLALMIAVVSALLFNTPGSRHAYMWVLVGNGAALSFWGIIQRANGNRELLPGVGYDVAGVPFASFVYKNAGAAALLPTLAMIAALLLVRKTGTRQLDYGGQRFDLLSIRTLTLISFAALIVAGLVATLSRGAWVAAIIAVIAVASSTRFVTVRRQHVLAAVAILVTIVGLVAISGIRDSIVQRSDDLSIESVSTDQRWDHWVDGWHTAVSNLPWGTGMGTYGYATLPHQRQTYRNWFDHAHNQFLETLTETGIVGSALLLVGIVWFVSISMRLLRARSGFETRQWGLIGCAILACGMVQSLFDFVLIIPANLLLYASLMGIIAVVPQEYRGESRGSRTTGWHASETAAPSESRSRGGEPSSARRRFTLIGWSALSIAVGIWAWQTTSARLHGDAALMQTDLTAISDSPEAADIESRLRILDAAIEVAPDRGELYARRGKWHLLDYRRRLVQVAAANATTVPWENTQIENLYRVFAISPTEQHGMIRRDLLSNSEMMNALANALADYGSSLACNPYLPQTRLQLAQLSPIVAMPVTHWTQSAAPLLNNSCEMLYSNGVLAFYAGDVDQAIDQWQKSLAIHQTYIEPIYALAISGIPPVRVVTELIPTRRPDLLLRVLDSVADKPLPERIELADQIIAHLEDADRFTAGIRHATIAQIHERLQRRPQWVQSWARAVQSEPRNLRYRHRYALALQSTGQLQEALDQASLAHAIDARDDRFDALIITIRRQIAGRK